MHSVQGSRQGTWQFVRLVSFDAPLPNDLTSLGNTQSLPEDHEVGIYAGEKKHQQDLHLENRTLLQFTMTKVKKLSVLTMKFHSKNKRII